VTEKDSSKVFFGYDSLYRLKSERRTGAHTDTMTYTYDPVGNRLTKAHRGVSTTYAYNNRDQLLSEWDGTDSTRYSYDSAGRMLTKAETGGTTHYRWRDEDRLDSLYGPGVSVKYQYDADGRRVKDSTGSTVRQYLIDPLQPYGQVIAETDGSNSLISEYVVGLDRMSLRRSGAAHYYLADGQGSTRLLTDSTGTATDSTVYTAFGETIFSSGSTPNAYLYTGEQFDGSAGLYNLRARLMDPRVGRFVSVDPFAGDPQAPFSLHRYLYANASPLSFFDPTGRFGQAFGYAVEDAVEPCYASDHPGDDVQYGKWTRIDPRPRLKPDILNRTQLLFNEIKPLSFSGLSAGGVQIALYEAMLAGEGYLPDFKWVPPSPLQITDPASGRSVPTWFVNVGGIIFYTDIKEISAEVLTATSVIALYDLLSKAKSAYTLVDEGAKIGYLISKAFQSRILAIREIQSEMLVPLP
jgi:RHS repeat-associated protein